MGRFVNPGNSAFQDALSSKIYVDKTELISYTNSVIDTTEKFICNSRRAVLGRRWQQICLLPITVKTAIQKKCFPN